MTESLVVRGDLDLSSVVFEHILAVAQPLFEQADRQRGYIHTAEDVCARRDFVRDALLRLLGGFPERTELHPRVVGRLDRDGYVVEKLLFESRPGFHVTANLYLPTVMHGPAPAVLVPCGHAADGKAHAPYQTLAQGLARQGFIALVYDSIGHGERSQYWSPVTHRSRIGPCIPEHDHAGTQALLVGTNLAAHLVWDGIRALDALCLRDEVDTSRIGCTGDGVLAACLFALDERIAAAMPVGYVTTRQAWLETGRFADAEHVQDKVIAQGIDHADLLVAGAPRPVRIAAAKTDVPIEGARQTVDELKRMYGILDVADRVDLFEAEDGGDFGQPLREAAYQWFQQWLGDPAADTTEPAIELERPEDLWCAPEGQVATLGSRTVFSLTREQAATLPPPAPQMFTRGDAEQWQGILRAQLRDLLHCPPSSGSPLCDQYGAFYRGKVGIELLTYQSERGVSIPALLFVPEQGGSWPGMVYVHEHGKEAEADPLGTIQMLAGEGNVVLAIDVRGIGETASADHISGDHPHMGVDGYHFYQYGMLGHSLVGRRVHDVLRAVALLLERPEVQGEAVSIVGQGMGGLLALLAAALDGRVGTAVCCQSPISYRQVARQEYHNIHPSWFVPGILNLCDLPEVAACVAPRRLVLAGPVDHMRRHVAQHEAEGTLTLASSVYRIFDAEGRFQINAT